MTIKINIFNNFFFIGFLTILIGCNRSNENAEYYASGKLKSIGDYQKEKKHGEWVYFKENGDTSKVIEYSNGDTTVLKEYFNGLLLSIKEYRENIPMSEKNFYPNGMLQSSYRLKDGMPVDSFVEYYENGQLRLKTESYGNGLHLFYDSLGFEYKIFFKDFNRVDSLTEKTGNRI